jgi:hypothetical protein
MGRAAHEHVAANFSADAFASSLEALVRLAAQGDHPAPSPPGGSRRER